MSHNRIKSALVLAKPTPAKTSSSSLSLSNFLFIAPLLLLSVLPKVGANEIVDGLELSSNTWYQFKYPLAIFTALVASLIDKCGIVFSTNSTNTTFNYAATPQCTQNGIPGPGVIIDVETGKNLTASLVDCMNKVMLDLCKDYYNHHPTPPKNSDTISIFILVAGSILLVSCITGLLTIKCCSKNSSSSSEYRGYGTSNDGFFTGLALGSMLSSNHSSCHSSSSSSPSSNVGVTWSFGQSPV